MSSPYLNSLAAGLAPDPELNYVEWANRHFYLPREAAAEYGIFRTSRTPFIEQPLIELSPMSPTQTVIIMKPAQMAGSTCGMVFICGGIALYPGPAMWMTPTEQMARSLSKKKLQKIIDSIPALREKIPKSKSRDSENTILEKHFPGGSLMLRGSNSQTSFRAESIKYMVLDDLDGFESDVSGEGSPQELSDRRTGSFPGRKILVNSTPTLKGSPIDLAFEESSQGYYHVPCPHCGAFQFLEWGGPDTKYGIKFSRDVNGQVDDVWYQCKSCHVRIDESEKSNMLLRGRYVHEYPERKIRGFTWNALYAPAGWINTWKYIVERFLDAAAAMKTGNHEKMKTWMNTLLALPYERQSGRETEELIKLCDDRPDFMVPSIDGIRLISGCDVQDDGIYYIIRAYEGDYLESWLVNYGFVDSIEALHQILYETTYKDIQGHDHYPIMRFIDSAGHRTAEIYNYARDKAGIFAIRGERSMDRPIKYSTIETMPGTNRAIPGGLRYVRVDTNYFKDQLSHKLKVDPDQVGAFHLHRDVTKQYFRNMTAEYVDEKTGFWTCPPSRENHLWDCEVYCLAAAHHARHALKGRQPATGVPAGRQSHDGTASISDQDRALKWPPPRQGKRQGLSDWRPSWLDERNR